MLPHVTNEGSTVNSVEPIAAEDRQRIRVKSLLHLMEQKMCISRGSTADVCSKNELALGGERSPELDAFSILFGPGYQFIQLQVADG